MTESSLPTPPATTDAPAYDTSSPAPARRTWRDRLPSGRKAVAAGAVVAGLAIGGAGFGAGYAVGDGSADTATTQTTDGWDRGQPGDGRGPMGEMGVPPGDFSQGQGGTTDQAPDLDGDGQPDTDSDSGSTTDSALNS